MAVQAGFSRIAALLADPAREAMLVALADGRVLPAGELARTAGVTPQSASGHLRKLIEGGIVSVWSQGRFRYFRLANEQVGAALESLACVAQTDRSVRARNLPAHLVAARCCYSHLAGRLGVALADALLKCDYVTSDGDSVVLTDQGAHWARSVGFCFNAHRAGPRDLRLCLDWTERRFHFAGDVPTAILHHLLENHCLERGEERSLIVTSSGKAWFGKLGIDTDGPHPWLAADGEVRAYRGTATPRLRSVTTAAAPPRENLKGRSTRRSGRSSSGRRN
jgi:DNA-binding transcriptional ArsR family regulator